MITIRGTSKRELLEKIDNTDFGEEEELYINKELTKDLAINILESSDIENIYLPKSMYGRTSKKLIKALEEIEITIKPKNTQTGRPTDKKEIILNLKKENKTPKEIAKITGINLKTVEYHYYKVR